MIHYFKEHEMRTTLTAVSALALLASVPVAPANAADVYTPGGLKDTPYVAPAPTWTGFIVGIGAVGAYVNHDTSLQIDNATIIEANGLAGFGPGADFLVGFRYQFPQSRLVLGIEAEYDITSAPFTLSIPPAHEFSANIDLQGQWAILGTIGLVINPKSRAYVGGGFGEGFFHINPGVPGPVVGLNSSPTVQEAVFKAGLEAKLPWVASGAFIRGEYEFRAGETVTLWSGTFHYEGTHTIAIKDTPDTNVAKVVLGYQFGTGSGPLEAFK